MRIRKFRAEDSAELARLHRSTIRHINKKDYPPKQIDIWSRRTSARRFRDSTDKFVRLVAVEKGKIVGYCDIERNGEFGGLYIHKDHQGKGFGTALLKKVESKAYKLGIRKFSLISTITAKNFYIKMGYSLVKKTKHPMGKHKLIVYKMQKRLKAPTE